jgi:hypothetical protein
VQSLGGESEVDAGPGSVDLSGFYAGNEARGSAVEIEIGLRAHRFRDIHLHGGGRALSRCRLLMKILRTDTE